MGKDAERVLTDTLAMQDIDKVGGIVAQTWVHGVVVVEVCPSHDEVVVLQQAINNKWEQHHEDRAGLNADVAEAWSTTGLMSWPLLVWPVVAPARPSSIVGAWCEGGELSCGG